MLAKVVKKQAAARLAPISFPQIGEPNRQPGAVSEYHVPDAGGFAPAQPAAHEKALLPSGEEVLQKARAEAARIIAEAEQSKALIEQAAYEKAAIEARAAFETELAARAAAVRENLVSTFEQIASVQTKTAADLEIELVELALEIAKKIVGREVTIDREVALTLAKISLAKLNNRTQARVHLHPDDFAYIQAHRERLNFQGSIKLVEDRSISLGGCLVHTETGEIDARIESQFDEIVYGLLGETKNR